MEKGISVYLGLDYTIEENINYIRLAKEKGFSRIFTSMHIPEANHNDIKENLFRLLNEAKRLDMTVNVDISPNTFKFFELENNDLKSLLEYGIRVVRLDFGFTVEEIANFSNNNIGLKIELNASTLNEEFLIELEKYNVNFSNILACHNYYPKKYTGISEELLVKRNNILKQKGICISAFIPSLENRRGPIYEGLPTLEKHRDLNPYISAKHLFALGIDNVYIGDSQASMKELELVGGIITPFEFSIDWITDNANIRDYLESNLFTQRLDEAEYVVRIEESRYFFMDDNNKYILENTLPTGIRKKGCITIDNLKYKRYAGEIQICKIDLPHDDRVNLIAQIKESELYLLDYIKGGDTLKFKLIN